MLLSSPPSPSYEPAAVLHHHHKYNNLQLSDPHNMLHKEGQLEQYSTTCAFVMFSSAFLRAMCLLMLWAATMVHLLPKSEQPTSCVVQTYAFCMRMSLKPWGAHLYHGVDRRTERVKLTLSVFGSDRDMLPMMVRTSAGVDQVKVWT